MNARRNVLLNMVSSECFLQEYYYSDIDFKMYFFHVLHEVTFQSLILVMLTPSINFCSVSPP